MPAAAAAAAADPSTEEEEAKSTAMAADRLPTDILLNIQRYLPLVDYLRFPAVCTAWRSATRDRHNLPHLPRGAPWLFIQAYRNNAIYAIDCIGKSSAPKAHRFPLPDDLHGYRLRGSIGHHLLLEKQGSLSGIRLLDPFSSSTHAASLPPSASLAPPPRPTSRVPLERRRSRYLLHNVVADTSSGIAVGLMQLGDCRLAYTWIHGNPDNPDNSDPGRTWFNLTRHIPEDVHFISFGSAVVHGRGRFCLVDLTGTLVFSLDLSSPPEANLSSMTFDLPNNYSPRWEDGEEVDWCSYQSASLVTSGSSLFLVRWRTILNKDKDGVKKKRRDIDIHRLDGDAWVPVHSLGDRSFFIDRFRQSISVSAADFPDIMSNRVYLALDAAIHISGDDYKYSYDDDGEGKLGYHLVHDLGDKSWGVFYDDDFHAYPPRSSFWMIPRAFQDAELTSNQKLDP